MSDELELNVEGEPSATQDDNQEAELLDTETNGKSQPEDEGEPNELEEEPEDDSVSFDENLLTAPENKLNDQGQKQLEKWLNYLLEEKKDLPDAPQWLQPRLKQELKDMGLYVEENVQTMQDQKFSALKESLKGIKMTPEQAKVLTSSFKSMAAKLGKFEALEFAMFKAGVNPGIKEAEKRGAKAARMKVPSPGMSGKKVEPPKATPLGKALGITDEDVKKYGKKS